MKQTQEFFSSVKTDGVPQTILIVEDSKGLNRMIDKILQRGAFQTAQAFDGESALALACQYPDSIMLLDYILPDMTAPQLIERLREQGCDIPFIMMTGQGDERVAVDMMKLGARDYIIKQSNFLEVLPRILRRVSNELEQQQRVVQAEQARRESERRFRATLENVKMIALMLNREGNVTFCNEYLLQLLGKTRDEVLGRDWFATFLPPENQEEMKQRFIEQLAGENDFSHHEYEIISTAGERRLIAWSKIILRDTHGRVIGTNSLGEDITERKQGEQRQHLTAQIFSWLNSTEEQTGIIHNILLALKEFSGVEAVGIRLQDGEDFPYYETKGFSEAFITQENSLCRYDENGELMRDKVSRAMLDCICGTVITGQTDPSSPFFTEGGSFWINDSGEFLETVSQEDRHFCTRCHCVETGYHSIALVPLRAGDAIIGLLQLNDTHPNAFTQHSIRFFEEIGASIGIAITRKRTEEHLRQLQKALETMHLGVTISDLDRKIVYTNPADAAMHGYTEDELIGQHAAIFAPRKLQHPLTLDDIERGRNWVRESINLRKDGSSFPVQLSSDLVKDAEGHPIAIVTTCEDITERKRAEEISTQERNLLRTLIDNLPDYIFVKDTEGRFLLNNAAHANFLGVFEPDGLIGTTVSDYLSAEAAEQDLRTDRDVLHSGVPILNQEWERASQDGEAEWRLVTKIPLGNSDNQIIGLVGISRDISEQKQAQNALESQAKELEERVNELSCLSQISHLTDNETLSLEDILDRAVHLLPPAWKYPNIACARIRLREREFTTHNFVETSWKQEGPIVINNTAIGAVEVCYVTEMPDAHDGPFLLEERNLLNMIAERLGELVEKKRVAEAIRESQQLLQSTLDSLSAHIAILNEHGDIIEVNASWKEFAKSNKLRHGENYYVGYNYLRVCETATGENSTGGMEAARGIRAVLGQEHETFYQEYPCHSPATQRWFVMRVTCFQSNGSTRVVIAHENITERKLAETALQNTLNELESRVEERTSELVLLNEQLERASRLKDEFLANMSHELRTPLNAVLGYAQILRNAENLTEQQQEALTTVKHSGEHLLSMINEILDLSRIEAGQMPLQITNIHLPHFLKSLAAMIRIRAKQKSILFRYEPQSELPVGVQIDEKRLREVLLNLLGNAVKFTGKGSVTFRVTSCESADASIHSPDHKSVPCPPPPLTRILFEVEDTGPGIALEHIRDIFLPFHQIKGQSHAIEGTGLGLTISRKLVSIMGGELHVESTPGIGSRFWFTLSVQEATDSVLNGERTRLQVVGYAGKPKTILVVDDITGNRAVLEDMLLPLGFKVVEAKNGEEGLELARHYSPDAILLDLLMPGIDGYECARRIRRQDSLQSTTIIAISASAFDEIRQRSLQAGCDDFLAKPFEVDDLLDLLQQYLALEWVYANDNRHQAAEDADIPPEAWGNFPEADLHEMLEQAMRGNVKEILKRIEMVEAREPSLLPLTQDLRNMAKRFEVDRIVERLQQGQKIKEDIHGRE